MGHRRLKVLGAQPDSPTLPDLERRVRLPQSCVAIGDMGDGSAARWALPLLAQFSALGRPVSVIFTGFGRLPDLDASFLSRCGTAASRVEVRAVAPQPSGAAALWAELSHFFAGAPCWLLVGAPALIAFEAPLSVLITQGRAPHLWPQALRKRRETLALELSEPRASTAVAFARTLVTTQSA